MSRIVTLMLVDGDGVPLGTLPPFETGMPYWQEMTDVVHEVDRRYGLVVDVLRLLRASRPAPHGGAVTYLAEVREPGSGRELRPIDLAPVTDLVPADPAIGARARQDHPLRAAYARVGGPADSLAWARDRAREVIGPSVAVQRRSWNLSALWRLEGAAGAIWLKQLPAFLAHEPAALSWLAATAPELAPPVLAVGSHGRQLLADVAGEDHYLAGLRTRLLITERAHRFQRAGVEAADHLVAVGVPDRRGDRLTSWIRSSLQGWSDGHAAERLLADLDDRMARVAACGVPDTLAHGDSHPGNVRGDGDGDGDRTVFLDWGDSYVGQPAFDILGLVGALSENDRRAVLECWAAGWRRDVPGSDPLRSAELLEPVALLRAAAVYAEFVANIEPSEHPYHAGDVVPMLDAAVEAAATTEPWAAR